MGQSKNKKKKGLPPGTVVYTGNVSKDDSITIYSLSYDLETVFCNRFLSSEKTDFSIKDDGKVHWYDIRGIHSEELIKQFGTSFEIHSLILEDIVNVFQRPKFEDFGDGIFISLKALDFDKNLGRLKTEQISIYFKNNILLSFQEYNTDLLEGIRLRIETAKGKVRAKGTDYLAHAIIDSLVDNYLETLETIDDAISKLEQKLIDNEDTSHKLTIYNTRREVLAFRSFVTPVRELVNKFAKSENELVQDSTKVYLRDVQDHISQVLDTSEDFRDTLNGLYDLLMTNVSFKMNQVMKTLTIISTIFIPLTFLAGVYGMNFDFMPELRWKYGYYVIWGTFTGITASMIWYFKRKKWF